MSKTNDALSLLDRGLIEPPTQRGRATRAKLLAAAEDCFAKHGFEGTTIALIAATARVSHGNYYRHFADKDAILIAIIAHLYGDLREASGAGVDRTTEVTLESLVARNSAFFRNYAERRHLFRVTREAAARPDAHEFRQMWLSIRAIFVDRSAAWIKRCQENNLAAKELDARATAEALGAMTEQMAYVELGLSRDKPTPGKIEQLGRTAGEIWHRAVRRAQ